MQFYIRLFLIHFIIKAKAKVILKIDHLDYKMAENGIVKIDVASLNYTENMGTHLTFRGTLDQDLSGKDLNLKITVTRCSSRELLDSCEVFRELHPKNFCMFFDVKGAAWSEMVESFNPPFKCPFKKGAYELKNKLLFDVNKYPLANMLVGPSWNSRNKFYNGKTLLFELYVEFRIVQSLNN